MVKVICRIKPPLSENTEITDNKNLLLFKKEDSLLEKNKIIYKKFSLDRFYDTYTSNYTIFREQIKPLMNNSFYLFLYGHTGSGKTFTIFGNENNEGLVDIILQHINYNAKIEALELSSIGCIDIFDNKIVTLLEKDNKIKLYNLSHKIINNKIEFNNILNNIKNKRKTGTSKHNSSSSRTHLIINIYSNNKKYVIIDLAGNERKPEMKKGSSYIDTNYINSSLLALKECFRKSTENSSYIPYRRSKLTRLLKNIFETDVKSIIISTIHSGFKYQNDTYDTLSYISQFKNNTNESIIKKKYSDYLMPHSKYKINKPKSLSKLDYKPIVRPKTSPTSINLEKKSLFLENKSYLKPLNIKKNNFTGKYDPLKYMNKKYKLTEKISSKPINIDYSYKYEDDESDLQEDMKRINSITDIKKNNIINDYEKQDLHINNKIKYDIIDDDTYKKYGIFKKRHLNENSYKIIKAINHIIYSRSIKNYVKLINNEDNEDKIFEVLNGTIATIEIVLAELNKIYH